jgi:putative ABC transport system permease protein
MLNKELGFNKEHLVIIEGTNNLGDRKDVLKAELKQNPQIMSISYSDTYPGEIYGMITGFGLRKPDKRHQYILKTISADADYFDTYQMEMVHGRKFSQMDHDAVIINESAIKLMGIENDPLHHHLQLNDQSLPIIGVVKNFHHDALNISLDPMVILLQDNQYLDYMIIRLAGSDTKEIIQFIHKTWNRISNNIPFEYYFLDEKMQSAYKDEMKVGKVFSIFSVLSILIACMGILGIASFLLQKRIKEIGIRKVNGATIIGMIALLNKEYVKWVGISFLIATPVAWYLMHQWLNNFAFRTKIDWWIFVFAGVLAMLIAVLTISWHIWKAATRNPVEALRYE